jgi:uncharacterized DUF497 family protein
MCKKILRTSTYRCVCLPVVIEKLPFLLLKGTHRSNFAIMQTFNWDQKKNEKLKAERGVSFEQIVFAIENEGLLDDIQHPSRTNQRLFIVFFNSYVYIVPYVKESKNSVFLKTIIPSRKAVKKYLEGKNGEKI